MSGARGIYGKSLTGSGVLIQNTATIAALNKGIYAHATSGSVSVEHTGNIQSLDSIGIHAQSFNLTVGVTSDGVIESKRQGIYAFSGVNGYHVDVSSRGTITSHESAGIQVVGNNSGPRLMSVTSATTIYAATQGIKVENYSGSVAIDSTGDIFAGLDGIYTRNLHYGSMTIRSDGSISSYAGRGIFAQGAYGSAVSVTSEGNIAAELHGITATSTSGAVTVDSKGDIGSQTAIGIRAVNNGAAAISVTSVGSIDASQTGIYARSPSGAVTVDSNGNISSGTAVGIRAINEGAGAVSVTSAGAIDTAAMGIFARSTSGVVTVSNAGRISAVNGQGIYAHSDTGTVAVASTGDVTSQSSFGIVALNSSAATVSVTSQGAVTANATGIYARSQSGAVTIDSTGDISSASEVGMYARTYGAANVLVTSKGGITARNAGIYARSETGTVTVASTGNITSTNRQGIYARASSGSAPVIVGSNGGIQAELQGILARSQSGIVSVASTGGIASSNSIGIDARSGGAAVSVTSDGDITASLQGILAHTPAGTVAVTSSGNITSQTNRGIDAQNEDAATVAISSRGAVTALLDGIYAHSLLGAVAIESVGNVHSQAGRGIDARTDGAQAVTVTSTGNILASQEGIHAESSGGAVAVDSSGDVFSQTGSAIRAETAAAPIDISVRSGVVFGPASSVAIVGGGTNSLVNSGVILAGALAVEGGTGDESVDNYGAIAGNVDLGAGANAFVNHAGAAFLTGAIANIGAGNTLTNEGILSPGGTGDMLTTALTGNLVQTESGLFSVDVGGEDSDVLAVSGTAVLAGSVAPYLVNFPTLREYVILETLAPGDLIDDGIVARDTLALDYELSVEGSQNLVLTLVDADFAIPGLTPNEQSVASYLNRLFALGGGAQGGILVALGNMTSLAELEAALDRLQPETYLTQVNDTLTSSHFFLNSMLSCPVADGAYAIIAEDQCVWARIGGYTFEQDRTWTNIGGKADAWTLSGGAQAALHETWRLGFAAAYERASFETTNQARSEGDRATAGAVLKNRYGPFAFSGAVYGGYGWFDTTRTIALAGIGAAEGEQEIALGGLNARLSLLAAERAGWYVKPLVDLNAVYIGYGGVTETGGAAANLAIAGNDAWVLSAGPMLEIGGDWQSPDGSVLRPFVRVGATIFDDMSFTLTSSFLSAPLDAGTFTIASDFDKAYLDLSAGIDLLTLDGLELRAVYEGRFSEHSELHAGSFKAGWRF